MFITTSSLFCVKLVRAKALPATTARIPLVVMPAMSKSKTPILPRMVILLTAVAVTLKAINLVKQKKRQKLDKSDDSESQGIIEILKCSIAKREKREQNQESDNYRLFLLSLLKPLMQVIKASN